MLYQFQILLKNCNPLLPKTNLIARADRDTLMRRREKKWYKDSFGAGKYLLMKKIIVITFTKEQNNFSNLMKGTVHSPNITLI